MILPFFSQNDTFAEIIWNFYNELTKKKKY